MYVYLIGPPDGRYKIGFSGNPHVRLRFIAGPDFGLRIVHLIRTKKPRWLERYLQQAYRHRHITREWFGLLDAEVAMIQTVAECDGPEELPLFLRALHLAHAADHRLHLNGKVCKTKIVRPRLRAARIAAGLSQHRLGMAIGRSGCFIGDLEIGKADGTPGMWSKLGAALQESPERLAVKITSRAFRKKLTVPRNWD